MVRHGLVGRMAKVDELAELDAVAEVKPVPRLDFGDWHVAFPTRGCYEFLSSDELRETCKEQGNSAGLWLGRTESGVSVVLPVKLDFRRAGLRPVTFAVLHHNEILTFAGHDVRFHEVRRITLSALPPTARYLCLQCRARFGVAQVVIQCPLCCGWYCDDCWTYLEDRRCYSRGCRYSPVPVDGSDTS